MSKFQTNYKAALTRNGLTENELTPSVKKSYSEVVSLEADHAALREELNGAGDEERASTVAEIEKLEKLLATLDASLVKKIDGQKKMKENAQRMGQQNKERLAAKKAAGGPAAPAPAPAPAAPAPAAGPDPAPNPAPAPNPDPPAAAADDGKDKSKKSNWLGWVVGAVVGAGAIYLGVSYTQGFYPFNRKR